MAGGHALGQGGHGQVTLALRRNKKCGFNSGGGHWRALGGYTACRASTHTLITTQPAARQAKASDPPSPPWPPRVFRTRGQAPGLACEFQGLTSGGSLGLSPKPTYVPFPWASCKTLSLCPDCGQSARGPQSPWAIRLDRTRPPGKGWSLGLRGLAGDTPRLVYSPPPLQQGGLPGHQKRPWSGKASTSLERKPPGPELVGLARRGSHWPVPMGLRGEHRNFQNEEQGREG